MPCPRKDNLAPTLSLIQICFLCQIQEVQVNIDRVRQVAQRLQDVAFCDVEVIDALVQKLDNEWRKLLMAVERRSGFLVSSRSFHVIADKVRVSLPTSANIFQIKKLGNLRGYSGGNHALVDVGPRENITK